jgi:signal transduction histidine kinase
MVPVSSALERIAKGLSADDRRRVKEIVEDLDLRVRVLGRQFEFVSHSVKERKTEFGSVNISNILGQELQRMFQGYLRWRKDETNADYTLVQINGERIDTGIFVYGNADDLLVAFYDIFENAVADYAISKEVLKERGGEIIISAELINGFAHVVISDNGLGMAVDEIRKYNDLFLKACSDTDIIYVAPMDKRPEKGPTKTLIGLQHAPSVFADIRCDGVRGRMEVRIGTPFGTEFHIWLPTC